MEDNNWTTTDSSVAVEFRWTTVKQSEMGFFYYGFLVPLKDCNNMKLERLIICCFLNK